MQPSVLRNRHLHVYCKIAPTPAESPGVRGWRGSGRSRMRHPAACARFSAGVRAGAGEAPLSQPPSTPPSLLRTGPHRSPPNTFPTDPNRRFGLDGHRSRSRKSEGRGGQDHHRRQPRRQHRRRRLSDAVGRSRPAVQRNGCTWAAEGRRRRASTTASRASSRSRPRRSRAASTGSTWCPSTPDLAGANVELPRIEGSETTPARPLGSVRDRYLFTLLDCPPSLGPLTVNALVAADRVIVPVQTEYFALEGLGAAARHALADPARAEPAAHGARDDPHDARRPHAARARRRARGARALPVARVRHRRAAQRPARRGAELGLPVLRHAPHSPGARPI